MEELKVLFTQNWPEMKAMIITALSLVGTGIATALGKIVMDYIKGFSDKKTMDALLTKHAEETASKLFDKEDRSIKIDVSKEIEAATRAKIERLEAVIENQNVENALIMAKMNLLLEGLTQFASVSKETKEKMINELNSVEVKPLEVKEVVDPEVKIIKNRKKEKVEDTPKKVY